MSSYNSVSQAYKTAVSLRTQRERDADVFEFFASVLYEAKKQRGIALIKALADNARLWHTVAAVAMDDNNPQPIHIRKSMAMLANNIVHEIAKPDPDIQLLIETNGKMAAGLRGIAPDGG